MKMELSDRQPQEAGRPRLNHLLSTIPAFAHRASSLLYLSQTCWNISAWLPKRSVSEFNKALLWTAFEPVIVGDIALMEA